jgi:hypothetical protein
MKVFLNERLLLSADQWTSDNTQEIEQTLLSLLKALDCLNFFVDFRLYYSGSGMKDLVSNFDILDSLTDYSLTNPISQLRTILFEVGGIDWNQNVIQRADHQYYYQLAGGAIPYNVNNSSIAEATEYRHQGDLVGLLNLSASAYNKENPIHINRSKIIPPPNMVVYPIGIFSSRNDTAVFLRNSEVDRKYNWSKKHGENGKNVIQNKGEVVSPLLCNRAEAAEFFKNAVGFRHCNEMYSFDTTHKKFMVFKDEGEITPKQYHAYHPIDQDEVPAEVQTFLLSFL